MSNILTKYLNFEGEIPKDSIALQEYWKPYFSENFCGFGCPEKWVEVIHLALSAMKMIDKDFRIGQVKSKWGGLRIYFDTDLENKEKVFLLDLIVDWAEHRAIPMTFEDVKL